MGADRHWSLRLGHWSLELPVATPKIRCDNALLLLLGDDVLEPGLEFGRGESGGLALSREEIGGEAGDPVLADDLADLVPAGNLLIGHPRRKGFCGILPLE